MPPASSQSPKVLLQRADWNLTDGFKDFTQPFLDQTFAEFIPWIMFCVWEVSEDFEEPSVHVGRFLIYSTL